MPSGAAQRLSLSEKGFVVTAFSLCRTDRESQTPLATLNDDDQAVHAGVRQWTVWQSS